MFKSSIIMCVILTGVAYAEPIKCKTPKEVNHRIDGDKLTCLGALEQFNTPAYKQGSYNPAIVDVLIKDSITQCGLNNLWIVANCPGFSARAKANARIVDKAKGQRLRARLDEANKKAERERLAEERRRKRLFEQTVKILPRLRVFLRCKKCTDEQAIEGYKLAADMCSMDEGRREARAAIQKERRYGRRHGVINLRTLKEYSDYIRDMDDGIRQSQKSYREWLGKRFSLRRCRAHDKIFKGYVIPFGGTSYNIFYEG